MRPPPILVHVAGAGPSSPDHVQRCLSCGAELYDGRPFFEGRAVVLAGDDDGPSWWPAGALVATDRHVAGNGPVITYVVEAAVPLDDDEQPCRSR